MKANQKKKSHTPTDPNNLPFRTPDAFCSLTFSPTVVAMQAVSATTSASSPSNQTKLSKAIIHIQDNLSRFAAKLNANQPTSSELTELNTLKDDITTLNTDVLDEFATTKAQLQAKNLPQTILDRHAAALADYQTQMTTLLQNLNDIANATDDNQRKTKVAAAQAHLNNKQLERAHQESNPNDLGNKAIKSNPNNKAKETKDAFTQAGLFDTPYANLAALGDFKFDKLSGASDPAYLAATPEITLSQAIKDKAAELNHDPVTIYHWVRNSIEWLPTWGAMQEADSWVQLDPSFKQYTYQQGLDALAISGVDPNQLAQDFTVSGTVNEQEG